MIIMLSNNTGRVVKDLFSKYPDKMALLLNPHCIRPGQFKFKYAIDNAAFNKFDEKQYFKMLDRSKEYQGPLWVVVPDVVGCHSRTMALWHYYSPRIREYGYPLAFVAQDGCDPSEVPECHCVFVGGCDPWKMENFKRFVGVREWTHVGRVNSIGRLLSCERAGVDSVDGTGWMLARDKKFYDLMNYFKGDPQCSLF